MIGSGESMVDVERCHQLSVDLVVKLRPLVGRQNSWETNNIKELYKTMNYDCMSIYTIIIICA